MVIFVKIFFKMDKRIFLILLFFLFFVNTSISNTTNKNREDFAFLEKSINLIFNMEASIASKIRIDSVYIHNNDVIIYFNKTLSEYPIRDSHINELYYILSTSPENIHKDKSIRLVSNGSILDELVPNRIVYNLKNKRDRRALTTKQSLLAHNVSKLNQPINGLQNRHLAVWQSHGYYYEQSLFRWEWQRARIFQTVEDLYTQAYVLPFLVPMLENSGANVFIPRERCTSSYEWISDNDTPDSGYSEINRKELWNTPVQKGFANKQTNYLFGENPFKMGTFRAIKSIKKGDPSYIYWTPTIQKSGEYAVYISYHTLENSTKSARYTVKYSGGQQEFRINQNMGSCTWIYLGTFYFDKDSDNQYVILSNVTDRAGEIVTADAVKFGGGMGNIARAPHDNESILPSVSGYPRFTEGARYWLQWAGFNDSIYSITNNQNDYTDDFSSRGRWVNYLIGGSKFNPDSDGLSIPLDLALSFHTDAGTTLNDSIIGTLAIYTKISNGSDLFPNGRSRLISRYLTDMVQSQIVEDIKALYEPNWQRRGLWDRSYSESRTPNIPTILLELLSHQNFADMKYGLDPAFRFDVSRAIYKGILKYLSIQDGVDYAVHPLPVNSVGAVLNDNNTVSLSWRESVDVLEPTAKPTSYIVYTRKNGKGFDNGFIVNGTSTIIPIEVDTHYSFKVTAINNGGESFPSEILSVYKSSNSRGNVLIINGFDRVSAPASFASKDSLFAGFVNSYDNGVPYLNDISFIGNQYEFRREIPWMDDDSPGFGASYANYENSVVAGNSFDYPYIHGVAFAQQGYSYYSISKSFLEHQNVNIQSFDIVDVIMGKQVTSKGVLNKNRFSLYPKYLIKAITDFATNNKSILVSGSHIGTDIWDFNIDTTAQNFAKDILKYKWRTNHASSTGFIKNAHGSDINFNADFNFWMIPNSTVYSVEAPDGIEPSDNYSRTILRYSDNNISAGISYMGNYRVVVLGFPIESLSDQKQINSFIETVTNFFNK